jgi:hypothetical protein
VDIYALGAVLYELVTGRPPFEGSSPMDLLMGVVLRDPEPITSLCPQVPRDLATIAHRCLAKEPGRRYATAQDLADDLGRYRDGEPIRARPASRVERFRLWCRRNPGVAILSGCLALALLVGFAGITWKWYEADRRRQEADDERGKVVIAQQMTREEKDKAVEARNESQKLSAGVLLDKGIALAQRGEVGAGLLWML